MADAVGPHRCPICFKTYKRREHLQRHRSSHTSERPHRCVLCGAAFQRSDVLKRHLQSCDGDPNSSSSRRRACDRCVRQKKACNSLQPCFNCERRFVECRYSGSAAAAAPPSASSAQAPGPLVEISHNNNNNNNIGGPGPGHAVLDGTVPDTQSGPAGAVPSLPPVPVELTFDHVALDELDSLIQQAVSEFPLPLDPPVPENWFGVDLSQSAGAVGTLGIEPFQQEPQPQSRSAKSRYRGYSFDFLNRFTSRTGLVSSFECGTLAQRQQIVSKFRSSHTEPKPLDLQPAVLPLSTSADGLPSETPAVHSDHGPVHGGLSSWSDQLYDPIVHKLREVVDVIEIVVKQKPRNSIVAFEWSDEVKQKCMQFFSPARFSKFVELFWFAWHSNAPFMHRPTFDPKAATSILLATVALMGACVSPDPEDLEDAKMWFNCVEEMVFTDDDFCKDIEPFAPGEMLLPENLRKLQALQAAYLVCVYQVWEGTDTSKRRARRYRFSTVVSTARDIGIENARHPDYALLPKHEFNWHEYAAREQLIRINIWIFLLDTAFVIFNNLPHRMVIKEMKMHMATPEICFQAMTAAECIEQIHRWMPSSSPFCRVFLREAIETMCVDIMTPASQEHFSQLGPVNLFAMVSAIHYMIFQHQNLFAVEGQLVPIRNGLKNWIGMWETYAKTPSTLSLHGVLPDDNGPVEVMWKRVGFARFCAEYWLLGTLLAERLSATDATTPEPSPGHIGSSSPLSQMTSSTSAKARCPDPILDKYDQTSMRQVNDLINNFQKFTIGEDGSGGHE